MISPATTATEPNILKTIFEKGTTKIRQKKIKNQQ